MNVTVRPAGTSSVRSVGTDTAQLDQLQKSLDQLFREGWRFKPTDDGGAPYQSAADLVQEVEALRPAVNAALAAVGAR